MALARWSFCAQAPAAAEAPATGAAESGEAISEAPAADVITVRINAIVKKKLVICAFHESKNLTVAGC